MNTNAETGEKLIGLKEYAEMNGYNRSTVAYWCQKGMLKGAIKKPDAKSGSARYIYLIPKNEKPQKQTADIIGAKRGLLSAREYAKRAGCNEKTVKNWCRQGRMPGAQKENLGNGRSVWLIPEGTEPAMPYTPPKTEREQKPIEEKKPQKTASPKTEREISLYIRRYCGAKTYSTTAEELGINTMEIRARYDRLHERYGI